MLTFFIIILVVFIATVVPIGIKEEKKPGFPIVTSFIAAIIMVVAIVIPTTALVVAVGDTAEFVVSIDEFGDMRQNLYYDKADDQYFIVKADLWDMSKMQYREYLDTELVEQYLAHKEAIEKIPLFD